MSQQPGAKMGANFIVDLLANLSDEKAVREKLDQMTEHNRQAYEQAIEELSSISDPTEFADLPATLQSSQLSFAQPSALRRSA